jgi:hypothetical protein
VCLEAEHDLCQRAKVVVAIACLYEEKHRRRCVSNQYDISPTWDADQNSKKAFSKREKKKTYMGDADELFDNLDSYLHIGRLENLGCHPITRLLYRVCQRLVMMTKEFILSRRSGGVDDEGCCLQG